MDSSIVIAYCGEPERSIRLVGALRRGRPSVRFEAVDVSADASADYTVQWFMALDPDDAVTTFRMRSFMSRGIPVITVDGDIADRIVDDSCAVIFGPDPTDEEFVRGMLPFLDSLTRYRSLSDAARARAVALMPAGVPRVSVLILSYNQQHTVAHAIESVLGQICSFPIELIIGDDASDDATREVCEEYEHRFPGIVRLMPAAPNKGVVDNYFDCFEAARGEYITDCSGDDYWLSPLRLSSQVHYLSEHPGDVAVMGDWVIHTHSACYSSASIPGFDPYRIHPGGDALVSRLLDVRQHLPLLSAILYRRSALMAVYVADKSSVRRAAWGCEDLPLLVALASQGYIGYAPCRAVAYVQSDGSITGGDDAARLFRFYIKAATAVIELGGIYSVNPQSYGNGLDARLRYLGWLLRRSPSREHALAYERLCALSPAPLSLKVRIYRLIARFYAWRFSRLSSPRAADA